VDSITVRHITALETHDLRRRVMRSGGPEAGVDLDADHHVGAWHLGAFVDGRLAGVVSFYPVASPHRPGRVSEQFRMMAVEPEMQGHGVGRALMEAALAQLRSRGVDSVWANARDSALGFYRSLGFEAAGEGFVHQETGLPHTIVVRDLR
jgi:GNAT superfamily N-acetyltransferase